MKLLLTEMTPRSRTGKLMQGLFGRFGNKNPDRSPSPPPTFRPKESSTQREIDEEEFPSARVFDVDDEETNWDDIETIADEQNPIVYAQPIVPAVAPPQSVTPPTADVDDWDDALPAPTVKNSNIQEARRSKKEKVTPVSPNADIWEDDVPSPNVSTAKTIPERERHDRVERKGGVWAGMLARLRRFLPPPLRQLSDAILTAIFVILVTLGIWIVDSLFAPPAKLPNTATQPPATTTVAKSPTPPAIETPPITEPPAEIDATQTTLGERETTPAIESPTPEPVETPTVAESPAAPDLEAPPVAEPPVPTTSEPPAVVNQPLSPEQEFIEAIQAQLGDITSQYPDDLIRGLEVDIARNRAIVSLSSAWYDLDLDEQDRLVDRMWQQARANHFSKLDLRDDRNISIARSPVVGDRMIILQRNSG